MVEIHGHPWFLNLFVVGVYKLKSEECIKLSFFLIWELKLQEIEDIVPEVQRWQR